MLLYKYQYFGMVLLMLAVACAQQPKPVNNPVSIAKAKTTRAVPATPYPIKKVIIREPDLRAWVDELNMRLGIYDSISNQSSYTLKELSQFKLTAAEVDSLAKDTDEDHRIQGSLLTGLYQRDYFFILMDKILNHPAIRRYRLDDIISTHVVRSDDDKLYNITIPEKWVGAYQGQLSWIHYRANDGKNYNFTPDESSGSGDSFNTDGFDNIQLMQTKDGVKYLMDGQVISCNTCVSYHIQLVHFDRGMPVIDFSYSIGMRSNTDDARYFNYNPAKKMIEMQYTPLEGEAAECDCKTDIERSSSRSYHVNSDSASAGADYYVRRRGKSLKCLFRFDGHTFVLDEKRSRLPLVRDAK